MCHLIHNSLSELSINPEISEPVNGIPKILKLKITDIEFFKLKFNIIKLLKLFPNQWKEYFPEPKEVLLDKINGRILIFSFKLLYAYFAS